MIFWRLCQWLYCSVRLVFSSVLLEMYLSFFITLEENFFQYIYNINQQFAKRRQAVISALEHIFDNADVSILFWYLLIPSDTFWYLLIYLLIPSDTCWYLLIPSDTFWYLLIYLLIPSDTCWYLLIPADTCWYLLKHLAISHFLVCRTFPVMRWLENIKWVP